MKTLDLYDAFSNEYREYQILFGDEPKQSDPTLRKFIVISTEQPISIQFPGIGQIPLPPILDKIIFGGQKEFLIQIYGNRIVRVSGREYESQIPAIIKKNRTKKSRYSYRISSIYKEDRCSGA